MKVICTIPTATSPINGFQFFPHPDRLGCLVSEDLPDDAAQSLASIPGYEIVGNKLTAEQQAAADAAELADLRVRGAAAGVANADQKGLKKLREEVPAAEAAKAAAGGSGQ